MPLQTRYIYLLRYILPITDVIMLNIIYFTAYFLVDEFSNAVADEIHKDYVIVCNLLWCLCALLFGLYSAYGSRRLERIYRGTWRSVALHFVLFSVFLVFSKSAGFSRTFLVIFYVLLSVSW